MGCFTTAAAGLSYTLTPIGTLPGGSYSFATGIGEQGWAIGYADTAEGHTHAFVFDGTLRDLGTLGGRISVAKAILDDGSILGISTTAAGQLHAFRYTDVMQDLGPIRGTFEQTVGWDEVQPGLEGGPDAAGYHRTFLNDGTPRDLGTLGGRFTYGLDRNAAGDVVGYSENSEGAQRAFLFSEDQLVDLNLFIQPNDGPARHSSSTTSWVLRSAESINDSGQIAGYGTFDGQTSGFVLSPEITPVPEAGTTAAVAVLVTMVTATCWRRRKRSLDAGTKSA